MKATLSLLLLLSFVSCGNPHLNDSALGLRINAPVQGDPFMDSQISNPDGGGYLSITTNKPSQNGTLNVRNTNKIDIETTYTIEKGEHFRWMGGTFPGASGSCKGTQSSLGQCQLDIEFFADVPGDYSDTLIIKSFVKTKPEFVKTLRVPLKGKRLAGEVQPPVVSGPGGTTVIQTTTTGNSTTIQVSQTNANDEAIIVSYRFAKGEHFRFNGGTFPGTNGNCTAQEAGKDSCDLDIEFFSDVVGRFTDELIITYALKSNPTNEKTIRIPLIGEKTAPPTGEISVTGAGGRPSIDFGSEVVGSPDRTDKVVIENKGDVPLNISVTLEGSPAFTSTNNCPEVLNAKESCTVDVKYSSTAVGTQTGAVKVTSSVTGGATQVNTVGLTGKTLEKPVAPGELAFGNVSGQNLDFGSVDAGAEARKLIEVKNTGEGPVQLTTPVIAGDSFSFSGGTFPGLRGTCGSIILPGACTLELSFKPVKKGTYSGSLTLPQASGKTLTLNLNGTSGTDLPPVCYRIEEKVVRARQGANPTGIMFPYNKTAPGTTAKLDILYGSATNNYIKPLNRYTVKDAQVYVSYDVPVIPAGEELLGMDLDLDITKVIQDDYKDTESLCLSTNLHRLCSGREFELASWQKLRNPNFWSEHQDPVNTLYEDDFRKGAAGCGSYTCFYLVRAYSMTALFGLGPSELRKYSGRQLNLIFSDDTRLRSLPSLKLRTKKPVACQ